MRPGDTVARLGGDEFGLLLFGVEDAEQALLRLRDVIEREVEVRGLPLSVAASIGFVTVTAALTDADTLLQHADVAMYAAKAQHAGVMSYRPELDHYDAANLSLVGELRHAISAGELVLHYQPQTNLADGSIETVEALVRWQHPTHGLLEPDRFLPLAEQTDLIDKLTDWVLATALAEFQCLDVGGFGSRRRGQRLGAQHRPGGFRAAGDPGSVRFPRFARTADHRGHRNDSAHRSNPRRPGADRTRTSRCQDQSR